VLLAGRLDSREDARHRPQDPRWLTSGSRAPGRLPVYCRWPWRGCGCEPSHRGVLGRVNISSIFTLPASLRCSVLAAQGITEW